MTRKELKRRVRQAASDAGKAAVKVGKRIKRVVRKRRVRSALREAGRAAATAGAAAVAAAVVEQSARAMQRRRFASLSRSGLGFEVNLPLDFETAIARVTEALAAVGFGLLTRIDAHSIIQHRLNQSFRPFTILGVCHPDLAFRALDARPEMGLLLPCNVTVEEVPDGGSRVRIANPAAMLKLSGLAQEPKLRHIAQEAGKSLEAVADDLREHGKTPVM